MKPYYTDSHVTIYHGDCLQLLPMLQPVDFLLTDPPYGQGVATSGRIGGSNAAESTDYGAADWDVRPVPHWLMSGLLDYARWAVVWGGNNYSLPPSPCWLVWDKENTGAFGQCELAWTNLTNGRSAAQMALGKAIQRARTAGGLTRGEIDIAMRGKKTGLCYRWEEAASMPTAEQLRRLSEMLGADFAFEWRLVSAESREAVGVGVRCFRWQWNGMLRRNNEERFHPSQKPLALMVWCIEQAPDAAMILDPFMGSGTTLVAAKRMGKQATGIEREERYCEIAARRLSQGALDLFVDGDGQRDGGEVQGAGMFDVTP